MSITNIINSKKDIILQHNNDFSTFTGITLNNSAWNPPESKLNKPNICNTYNNSLRDTSEDCLRDLITNCEITTKNQNNVIDYQNCTSLLNYAKTYLTKIIGQVKLDYNSKITDVPGTDRFPHIDMTRDNFTARSILNETNFK